MITLQLTEIEAAKLYGLCDTQVKDIAQGLAKRGVAALGEAMKALRDAAGLLARLEAAGVSGTEPQAKSVPAATAPVADAGRDPTDEAPPPEVVAARIPTSAATSNGAKPAPKAKFVRPPSRPVDADTMSGP